LIKIANVWRKLSYQNHGARFMRNPLLHFNETLIL